MSAALVAVGLAALTTRPCAFLYLELQRILQLLDRHSPPHSTRYPAASRIYE